MLNVSLSTKRRAGPPDYRFEFAPGDLARMKYYASSLANYLFYLLPALPFSPQNMAHVRKWLEAILTVAGQMSFCQHAACLALLETADTPYYFVNGVPSCPSRYRYLGADSNQSRWEMLTICRHCVLRRVLSIPAIVKDEKVWKTLRNTVRLIQKGSSALFTPAPELAARCRDKWETDAFRMPWLWGYDMDARIDVLNVVHSHLTRDTYANTPHPETFAAMLAVAVDIIGRDTGLVECDAAETLALVGQILAGLCKGAESPDVPKNVPTWMHPSQTWSEYLDPWILRVFLRSGEIQARNVLKSYAKARGFVPVDLRGYRITCLACEKMLRTLNLGAGGFEAIRGRHCKGRPHFVCEDCLEVQLEQAYGNGETPLTYQCPKCLVAIDGTDGKGHGPSCSCVFCCNAEFGELDGLPVAR